jgi:alanine or glycine:cation symporter, AGCS family
MIKKLLLCCFLFGISANFGLAAEGPQPEKPFLARFNEQAFKIIFFDVSYGAFTVSKMDSAGQVVLDEQNQVVMRTVGVPFIVALLAFGAFFFTFYYKFINFRMFKHAVDVVRGKYDSPDDHGEISHFRALTSSLSATIGLGNIAGVAVAIQTGGPGAVFWMVSIAFFGMCSKFSSCTLSQLYRQVNHDGSISGGPMYYLDLGLKDIKLGTLGKVLGLLYAVMVMGGALGGGNMFQVNQTAEAFRTTFALSESWNLAIGCTMLVLVGMVILGGIQRIGAATSRIIPLMCGLYVLASMVILGLNIQKIPEALRLIFELAFTQDAVFGGIVGVMVTGITRAAFSNEAGLGSAAIIHAAAKTNEPVREGIVAMLGPFIDTVIVCNMTALVVIVTGAWNDPSIPSSAGVALTTSAFASAFSWFPIVLTFSIALFAYSTMISWCYYGERGWVYLFDHLGEGLGLKSVVVFRVIFLGFILIGATNKLEHVIDFSDVMLLSMAFPNILGSIILAPKVLIRVKDYVARYKSGSMKTYT